MQAKFDPLVAEWASFANSPNFNLTEKCLKFAQILDYPELDVDEYVHKIGHMGRSLKESTGGSRNPSYLIPLLNQHIFENMGFVADARIHHDLKDYFINEVVDRRSGAPLTLSVLYAEIAMSAGLEVNLVEFAGRILIRCGKTVLDPSDCGKLVEDEDLQAMLDGFGMEFEPSLDVMEPEQVLVLLGRSLRNSYTRLYNYEKALRCANMILAIEELPEDVRDKGILEERMLNPDAALKCLNRYLEQSPNADDVDFVLDLIRSIEMKS